MAHQSETAFHRGFALLHDSASDRRCRLRIPDTVLFRLVSFLLSLGVQTEFAHLHAARQARPSNRSAAAAVGAKPAATPVWHQPCRAGKPDCGLLQGGRAKAAARVSLAIAHDCAGFCGSALLQRLLACQECCCHSERDLAETCEAPGQHCA